MGFTWRVGKVVTRREILIDSLANGDVGFLVVVALDDGGFDYDGKYILQVADLRGKDMPRTTFFWWPLQGIPLAAT